jgi:uncharacterized protein (DUF488 family)
VRILTIGHSTRPIAEFMALLAAHDVGGLADVRTIPRSRRHPHFSGDALARSLGEAGVVYRHYPALGGLRRPRPDSVNTAWRHAGFRGYADYMETEAFDEALRDLRAWADAPAARAVALMCAEAVWWQCHRRLIADALVVHGVQVEHIMTAAAPTVHTLSEFAQVRGERLTYPGLI